MESRGAAAAAASQCERAGRTMLCCWRFRTPVRALEALDKTAPPEGLVWQPLAPDSNTFMVPGSAWNVWICRKGERLSDCVFHFRLHDRQSPHWQSREAAIRPAFLRIVPQLPWLI